MGTGLSCGHRSGSLRSPSSFKPLLQLKKYPDIPVCTIEEARGSRPHPEEPRFRLEARDEGSFPCFVGKELPAFPTHFKRRRSPQERREDLQRRATIPRVPQMFQSIPEEPVFPALPRLSRRGSTPPTVARGTAQWESLMGKPRGKATDPLIQATGSVTLLLPLWRKAHVHAPIRDEDLVPWGDSRRTPRSMSALERNPQVPALTPHKVLGPVIEGLRPRHQRERNSERPPRNSHGDWPFLRPPERVPEGPVGKNSRRSRRISRGGALHRKGERNSRVVPPFQESPRCVSPFQRNRFSLHCLDVQAEDRLPPRVHVGQPCGKASWESLVGKTRGKTIDALIHGADCVTLLLPLWRKAQVHARIRDED
ncbi:hypothetical protein MJG53_012140 [Ovis ammon polii x Ovis aries]|uniref:Uncharacterized protein n=1 Tax=Ovis ammon polii x Ovis aries TaxID=2918886 RepID=A0ACB9UQP2_9CETA|nr:hypothetical protein MJG53_012140 [Ovis ammon polii x Ovis aries]